MNNIFEDSKKIHLIAIGGAAMHNLALALKQKGYEISGSDDEIFEPSYSRLKNAGLLPEKMGWYPEKITDSIDTIILGMHARKNNPELEKALELGVPVKSYPEFLYEQTATKKRVVIAGSHGKTTITAIILHILKENNIRFDYMVGSQIEDFDTMVSLSDDTELAIFEGDEYLSSPVDLRPKFLHYKPHIGVISGIAWDHINVFPTFEEYRRQFELFVENLCEGGTLIYYANDELLAEIAGKSTKEIQKIPYSAFPYEIENETYFLQGENGERNALEIFGDHNMQNIAAAYEVCTELGVSKNNFISSVSSFTGTKRRLEKILEKNQSVFYADFAHSPSKVKATIEATKKLYSKKPLVAVFELHTFSSLNKSFLSQYDQTLEKADFSIIFYDPEVIKHKKLEHIEANDVLENFGTKDTIICTNQNALFENLYCMPSPAVFLFMSSGNFGGVDLLELSETISNQS